MTDLKAALYGLTDREFERFIADLWAARGWDTRVTSQTGDDGVDVVATKSEYYSRKILLQAKHGQAGKRLTRNTVQQYSYLHHKDEVDEVIIVTTGTFTSGAEESAKLANVKLIDLDTLVELIRDSAIEGRLEELGYNVEESEDQAAADANKWVYGDPVPDGAKGEIRDYAESNDVYARLLHTFGYEAYNLQVRIGLLLQLFRGPDSIDCFILSQPGSQSYRLGERVAEFEENSPLVNGAHTDKEALLGRYTSMGEVYPGVLRGAGDGLVRIKQFSEFDDRHPALIEPLEENQLSVASGSYSETLRLPASILAFAEPEYSALSPFEPVISQVPVHLRMYFGFDYTGISEWEKTEFRLPSPLTPHTYDVDPIDSTRVKQHIQFVNGSTPKIGIDAGELVEEIAATANEQIKSNYSALQATPQLSDSIRKLARASARIRLSETVDPLDVKIGAVGVPPYLISDSVETIIREIEGEEDDEPDSGGIGDHRAEGRTLLDSIEALSSSGEYEPGVPIEKVIAIAEELGFSKKEAEHKISEFKKRGDVYEPQNGYVRPI